MIRCQNGLWLREANDVLSDHQKATLEEAGKTREERTQQSTALWRANIAAWAAIIGAIIAVVGLTIRELMKNYIG
jgi:hypothetical protein